MRSYTAGIRNLVFFLLFFHSLHFSQNVFRGDVVVSSLFTECIDTAFVLNPLSESIPSNSTYIIDKYIYEVILTIRLYGNDNYYSRPLALTFNTPDNISTTHIINQELYDFSVDDSYEYTIYLQTSEKGWTDIEINEWDMHKLEIVDNIFVNFIDYSFYLE